jgi:ABC-type amino acid transport system permease subunit
MMEWGAFFHRYGARLLEGALTSLELVGIVFAIGLIIGCCLGVLESRAGKVVVIALRCISLVVSATPVLILLFWVHYPLQYVLGVVIAPFITAVAVLSAVMSVMVSNVVSNAIAELPSETVDTARLLGMNELAVLRRIQIPMILRAVIPSILMICAIVMQSSMFASLISVEEFFRVAQEVNAEVYRPVEIYTLTAVVYLVICGALLTGARALRSRVSE